MCFPQKTWLHPGGSITGSGCLSTTSDSDDVTTRKAGLKIKMRIIKINEWKKGKTKIEIRI